ncbi:hypothetical protein KIPB_000742, partial [Kipferlia bialata]
DWCKNLDTNLVVTKIILQGVDFFGKTRVGFAKMKVEATSKISGSRVPGIVFLRGGAVVALVIFKCEGEEYALVCKQARVPIGYASSLEIPAGMLDGEGHFMGVAVKELQEETGLEIPPSELIDMTHLVYGHKEGTGHPSTYRGVCPSGGGCDEFLRFFLHRTTVTKEVIETLRGSVKGEDAHEHITLDVLPLIDLVAESPNAGSVIAYGLYRHLLDTGKLPKEY